MNLFLGRLVVFAAAQSPRDMEGKPVAVFSVEVAGKFVDICIEKFRFRWFVVVRERIAPGECELPIFVSEGGLQGSIASRIAFGLDFEESITIVHVGAQAELSEIGGQVGHIK